MHKTKTVTILTLDGAAATGKSTTAHALADALNYLHIDTGSHFRVLSYHLNQASIPAQASRNLREALKKLSLHTKIDGHSAILEVNRQRLSTTELRSLAVNTLVSQYAALKPVRDFLLAYQHSLEHFALEAHFEGMVVEGRDIGSVVFPSADHKVFLHADESTRIARRQKEGLKDVINERDAIDRTRTLAPLTCPKDALSINTTLLSLDEVVDLILKKITD